MILSEINFSRSNHKCYKPIKKIYTSQVFEDGDKGIFRVDDVFVTGMLAEKANVSHR